MVSWLDARAGWTRRCNSPPRAGCTGNGLMPGKV